jgi:hypothetical protein
MPANLEARGRETFYTRFRLESESGQCGVSQETSRKESGYVATNTKSWRKALILNQFATVSKEETIVFHTKVIAVWGKITRNMLAVFGNGLIDDFDGGRKEN